ncbi:MAG: AbrB/MazE/SpoVT family DNA-binding domain-containing protein [Thermoanaerobaculia bacterium]|nr:AbrB/MazE/SpoVT family DNA-binding domain-containing protein [Thermoanaerobaculia bacterium]
MQAILTLDIAGRLALPEEFRRRHRLREGSRVRIAEEADRIVLEPLEEAAPLVERDGLLLVGAKLESTAPDHRQLREERLAKLATVPE